MATQTKKVHEAQASREPMELVPATLLGLALTALAWIYACWLLR